MYPMDFEEFAWAMNEDRTYVKCYMGDTGLLISHTFDENEISDGELYREILLGKLSVNEGMFYENIIAQMLVAACIPCTFRQKKQFCFIFSA